MSKISNTAVIRFILIILYGKIQSNEIRSSSVLNKLLCGSLLALFVRIEGHLFPLFARS